MHDKRMQSLSRIYLATSNSGKVRDFRAAAANMGITVETLRGFQTFPLAIENGATFEENARLKAEHYSRFSPGNLVVADDSGLVVHALNGAPGVHSARYAAVVTGGPNSNANSNDTENNELLIRQLERLPESRRSGKFVCVIAAAKDGATLHTFFGDVEGELLTAPRGTHGFGYDPLFYYPSLGKTFAELPAEEKALYSHRGKAFRKFLDWATEIGA
ncbi:MAG TPA: RdgB/HAM1 family non-canonical purine NTP pyrophosphatase [Candidatus Angelobacter sp.]